jgi:octaprenyl-diphosphate synthase
VIESWEEYLLFEKELKCFVEKVEANSKIKKALEYVIYAGGKRARPLIVLISGKMCGGNYDRLKNLAIAVELIHTASLVHDDIIDRAKSRRNRKPLHIEYDTALALVFGDWLISKSVELTSVYGEEVVRELARAGAMMSEGEIMDYYSTKEDFTEDDYFECIKKKTAMLFAYSAKIACKVVSRDSKAAEKLYEYGYNLGIAYQLVDDLLEYLRALKDKNSEIESITLPQIYEKNFGKDAAVEKVLSKIREFSKRSISSLEYFPNVNERKKLEKIVQYMTEDILKSCLLS